MCKTRDHMDFSQGRLDRIKAPHNCISKSICLQIFYKDRSLKFRKILRKTPAPEFLCNKVADFVCEFIYIKKETSAQVFTCEFCKMFQKTYLCRKFASSCFWKCFFYINRGLHCAIYSTFYVLDILWRKFYG